MADSDPRIPGNMKLNIRGEIPALGSAITKYFGTFPQHRLAIHVDKKGENATVSVTTDALDDGSTTATLSDLSASSVSWAEVSASGTTNYIAGDNHLITGVKVSGAPGSSAIRVNLTQVNEG